MENSNELSQYFMEPFSDLSNVRNIPMMDFTTREDLVY